MTRMDQINPHGNNYKIPSWVYILFTGFIFVLLAKIFITQPNMKAKWDHDLVLFTIGINNKANFSIEYPKLWKFYEFPEGDHGNIEIVGAILDPIFKPSIVIYAKTFSQVQILEDVAEWGKKIAKEGSRYKEIGMSNATKNNLTTIRREYVINTTNVILGSKTYHCLDWYFLQKSTGYTFSFCSLENQWDKLNPIFEKMILTLKFIFPETQ